jgi:tRNA A37 threonylcarbamoyladenosine dehydratase
MEGEIGRPKVQVLAERVRRIHPGCCVEAIPEFFVESSADGLLARLTPDEGAWVVDAVDRMSIKSLIIAKATERSLNVLTVGGAGGRRDPTRIRCGDLGQTGGDLLLRQVRRKLRRDYAWVRGEGSAFDVPAVYSAEPQVFPWSDGTVCAEPEPESPLRMDCASGFGAACFLTGAFGFVAAAEVVKRIAAG